MTRDMIKIQSVRFRLEGNDIGYIRLTTFNEQTDVGLERRSKHAQDRPAAS